MTKYITFISVVVCFSFCNPPITEYQISENYVGPGVIFISPNGHLQVDSHKVVLRNGLAIVPENIAKEKFIFKAIESNKEINIIEVGQEKNVLDSIRHVFRVFKGSSSTTCSKNDIGMIVFFVGTKSDFSKWDSCYRDELSYFDSIGVDWCSFYKIHTKE